jgi:hypothetical protein
VSAQAAARSTSLPLPTCVPWKPALEATCGNPF